MLSKFCFNLKYFKITVVDFIAINNHLFMSLQQLFVVRFNFDAMIFALHINLYFESEMGAKGSSQNPSNDYDLLLGNYEIIKEVEHEGLLFLRNKSTGSDELLREFTFNDKKQYEKNLEILEKKRNQLANCKYVVPLLKIISKSQDQYCSTFYKIYALFEFTDRTLQDQINERTLQKRKFQQKQLWSILASCILGLSHLQRNSIKHQSLRSNSILISQEGVIKIYDPITTGCQSNYDTLISKRSTPHIYMSPELTESLQLESGMPHCHAYKSDIWTLGMIILQTGLSQFQDECYRDESSRIHWQTLEYNIHRFKQLYSEQLVTLLEFMLSKEEKNRPDWFELEERVMKEEQSRVSFQAKQSMANRISENKIKGAVVYNAPIERKTITKINQPANFMVTSQAVPIYQDPARISINNGFRVPIINPPVTVVQKPIYYEPPAQIKRYMPTQFQNIVPIRPSNIEPTRPFRNIFPPNVYNTSTKIDQNLIVVPDQEHFSDVQETPNNRFHSSYFDSNPKSNAQIIGLSAGTNLYQPPLHNVFTPTQPSPFIQRQDQQIIQDKGVSVFQPPPLTINPVPQQVLAAPPTQQLNSSEGEYVVERYKQGSEYKGYKWNGMRHGYGIFYYQDGGMYEGEWKFNKMEGRGKLYYQSGKLAYDGEWSNDQFSGSGVLHNQYPQVVYEPLDYMNLDDIEEMWAKFEGQFKEDLKNGHGTLFLSNGQYFQGQFVDDQADGQGTYFRKNGEKIKGKWIKNKYVE